MTEKSKKARSVICVIVSFLLSVFLFLTAFAVVIRATALNSKFAVNVICKSGYSEDLHKELKEQFISYGNAGNVDESFFDSIFENVITPQMLDNDSEKIITAFYKGEAMQEVDTTEMQAKLTDALLKYAEEKNFAITDELKTNIADMSVQFGELYNSFVNIFANSYFQQAGSLIGRYTPLVNYAIIALAVLVLIAMFILRMYYKKRKNVYRYYIYSFSGATLMMLAGPMAALIMKIGNRINIGTASLYGLASGLINGILISFLIAAAVLAVLTALLILLRHSFIRKNK